MTVTPSKDWPLLAFMGFYRLLWVALLPVGLVYLLLRGRRDALYAQDIAERFAIYRQPLPQGAVWLHAVSLGETRSALALIRLLLRRGDKVIVTNFTPTGRREAMRQFAPEIASGQMAVVWVPFDMMWTYGRFFKACRPRIGLTLEVEVWPAMIFAAQRAGVPLYMCNGQYASPPLARDSRGLRIRQRVIRGLAGVFVKSRLQAERFAQIGVQNITVTGELRFDQPIPQAHLDAGLALRELYLSQFGLGQRPEVIGIASGVEGEEDLYVALIQDLRAAALRANIPHPLFIYVPRAPERFGVVAEQLAKAGFPTLRRSVALGPDLGLLAGSVPADTAVLLGDSLGEMFFYLSLTDRVIVGGGFTPRGAHNIIEPLSLGKPVLTGPYVWTIEYPFAEAEAASIASIAKDGPHLAAILAEAAPDVAPMIKAFLAEHAGASARTLHAIDLVLSSRPEGATRQG